jgi:hypothetical protein
MGPKRMRSWAPPVGSCRLRSGLREGNNEKNYRRRGFHGVDLY